MYVQVRRGRAGSGKRGGVRVVYFNLTERGEGMLIYAKAEQTSVSLNDINKAV